MKVRRLGSLLFLVAFAASTSFVFAAKKPSGSGGNKPTQKGTPLVNYFLNCNCTYGVDGDGVGGGGSFTFKLFSDESSYTLYPTASYANGDGALQVYIGGSGRDENLLTYNTGRTLRINFDPGSAAFQKANNETGLPASFDAESDMYGINAQGDYVTGMAVTDTAQMDMSLEFKVDGVVYKIHWPSTGAVKLSNDTWLLTTDPSDLANFHLDYNSLEFQFGPEATFAIKKRHSFSNYGPVTMHMRYLIKLQ